jgi:hypothetical protein
LEFELRPTALEELASVLLLTRKAVDQYRAGDERYSHLAESDIQKVQQTAEQTHKWLEEKRAALAGTPRTQNPPITVTQIRQEKQVRANKTCSWLQVGSSLPVQELTLMNTLNQQFLTCGPWGSVTPTQGVRNCLGN